MSKIEVEESPDARFARLMERASVRIAPTRAVCEETGQERVALAAVPAEDCAAASGEDAESVIRRARSN